MDRILQPPQKQVRSQLGYMDGSLAYKVFQRTNKMTQDRIQSIPGPI